MEFEGVRQIPTFQTAEFVRESVKLKPWSGPVIDIGAGQYADWYKPYFVGAVYKQLDCYPQPDGSTDIIADIRNMPQVPSNSFGVALLMETLEHVNDPFAAVKETARIIRPGGLFICTAPTCWWTHKHPKDYWRFLPDGLAYLCKVAGLTIFNEMWTSKNAITPSHCGVAAIKERPHNANKNT